MDLGTAVGAIKMLYDGSGVAQAKSDLGTLEQSQSQIAKQQIASGLALTGMGAGALKFIGDAVSGAADVESVLKSVEASTGATEEQLKQLGDLSGQLGADTIFDTQEVVDAADVLAKAGVSIEDQLGGSLKSVTDLAAATGESMTTSAGSVADAMAIFRLSGEDTAQVADLTTNALNASKIGLDEYNAGFRNLAPTMANFADSQEEAIELLGDTGEVIAFFTANGLKGADAGISFARMIQNLATPATEEYAAAIEEAGINLFDAEGNFVGAEEAIRQVNEAFEGLTDQEKIDLMDKLGIGAEAQDVVGIISAVGDGYNEFVDDMNSGNTAAEQAEIRMSGLKGALEGLSGTFGEIMRSMGEGLLAPLEGIVRAIDVVASAFLKLPDSIQAAIGAFIGFFGILATAAGAFMTAQAGLAALEHFFPGLAGSAMAAVGPIAAVAAALAAVFLAYQTNFLGFRDLVDNTLANVQQAIDTFTSRFQSSFDARIGQGANGVAAALGAVGDALYVMTKGAVDFRAELTKASKAAQAFGDAFANSLEAGMNPISATLNAIGALAGTLGFDDFQSMMNRMADGVQAFGDAWQSASQTMNPVGAALAAIGAAAGNLGFPEIQNQLVDLATQAQEFGDTFSSIFTAAQATGKSGPVAALQALGGAIRELTGIDVVPFFNGLASGMESLGNNIGNLGGRVTDAISSFFDLIGSEWGTLRDMVNQILHGDLQGAFDTLGDALGELGGNIGDTMSQLGTSLASAFQGVGDFLGGLGDVIGPALTNALNAAGDFITGGGLANLVQSVSNAVMDAFNAAGDWAGGIAATIGSALSAALQTIGNFLGGFNPGQIAQDVGSKLQAAFATAGEWISNVGATIGSALSATLQRIGDFLGGFNPSALASEVGGKISEAFANAGEFVSNVGATIGSALSNALNSIGNFLGGFNPGAIVADIWAKITGAFGGGSQDGGGSFPGGTGGASGVAQAIGGALSTALNSIGQYLSGFSPAAIAADIVGKLQSAFTDVSVSLGDLGAKLTTAVEEACNIDVSGVFDTLGAAVSGAGTAIGNAAMLIGQKIDEIKQKFEEIDFSGLESSISGLGAQVSAGMAVVQSAFSGAIDTIKAKLAELNFDDIGTKVQELGSSVTAGLAIVQSAFTGAISTITAELGKINFDAIKEAISTFAGELPGLLAGALGAFTGWVGDMVAQAQLVISKIGEIGGAIKDALAPSAGLVTNYTDTVGEGLGILGSLLGGGELLASDQGAAAAQQSGDFATNYIAAIADSFATADWSPVANAINTGLSGITSGASYSGEGGPRDAGPSGGGIGTTFVTGFIQQIVAAFTPEAFAPVKTAFDAALNAALSGAGQTAGGGEGGGTSAGATVIQNLFTQMGQAIGQNTETLVSAMQAAMTTLQGAVDQGVTGIQASMQAIVTVITQLAPAAAQAVVSMGQAIGAGFTAMQATINASISAIQASIQALVPAIDGISQAVGTAIQGMATTIQGAFEQMQSTVNAAVSGIQASVQAIIPALEQTAAAAGEAAASIGTAIVGALEGAIPAVTAAAEALGAAATVPIVGAILPGSPSRVILPVAESVPEAITTAYGQGEGAVEDAATSLGEAATEPVVSAVDGTTQEITDTIDAGTPAVEDSMVNMVTSAVDAARPYLETAADLFGQYGLTFGNEMTQGLGDGVDQAMPPIVDKLRAAGDALRQGVMDRVQKMHDSFLPDAESVIKERNPWAAGLMQDQEITVNVEANLDGEKMADWTVRTTLGGMLGVRERGGMKRGLNATR